jgi:hypothetical protein
MKKFAIIIPLLVLGGIDQTIQAQTTTTTAVEWLQIAPNSRASAMGEGGGALAEDVWAGFWNPGGYAFQKGSEVSLSHAEWLPAFNLSDLWIAHMAYKQELEELGGVVGAQLTYMNEGEFTRTDEADNSLGTFKAYEYALALSYGTKLSDNLGLGVTTRIIHSHLSDQGAGAETGSGTSTGFSFDVGMLYKTDSALYIPANFGIVISNIGPKMSYLDRAQADPLPMQLRLCTAVTPLQDEYNTMTLTMDITRLLVHYNDTTASGASSSDEFYKGFFTTWSGGSFKEQIRKFDLSVGAEYWYGSPRLLALRAGYIYEDPREGNRKYLTFGAGLRYDMYGFDFSYIEASDSSPLANTLRFTLSIEWGRPGE